MIIGDRSDPGRQLTFEMKFTQVCIHLDKNFLANILPVKPRAGQWGYNMQHKLLILPNQPLKSRSFTMKNSPYQTRFVNVLVHSFVILAMRLAFRKKVAVNKKHSGCNLFMVRQSDAA